MGDARRRHKWKIPEGNVLSDDTDAIKSLVRNCAGKITENKG